jgi:hypothetical protein
MTEKDSEPIKLKEIKKDLTINHENILFVPEMSDGFMEPQTGFFIKIGDKWIVSELTYFSGILIQKDEEGNEEKKESAVMPYLFYNNCGKRGFISPTLEKSIIFDGRRINLSGETTLAKRFPTLMTLESAKDFMAGKEVELKEVYEQLKARQKKFVNFEWDERLYDLMACITIATYFFDVFGAFPITFFYGVAGTGKGRGLKSITFASHRGFAITVPTEAVLFRGIDAFRPTLGLDEFTTTYEPVMAIIRTAYKKGESVGRTEELKGGKKWNLSFFETFCPLVIASTSNLDSVTLTRTIIFLMKNAADPNPSKKDPTPLDFEDIREKLYILRLTKANEVAEMREQLCHDNSIPKDFGGREWEIYLPPLTIAKMLGDDTFKNVLTVLTQQFVEKTADLYTEEKDVLTALAQIFLNKGKPEMIEFFPKDIVEALWQLKSSEYATEEEFQRKNNPKSIGWRLKRMGLVGEYVAKGRQYSLKLSDFKDLCNRYSISFTGF